MILIALSLVISVVITTVSFVVGWYVSGGLLDWSERRRLHKRDNAPKPKVGDWRIIKDPHDERYGVERLEQAPTAFVRVVYWQQITQREFAFRTAEQAHEWIAREIGRPVVVGTVRP